MVADNGSYSGGISDKDSNKYHTNVHEYTVGDNAVFLGIFVELNIVEHTDE